MSLNIKNARTYGLAAELARRLDTSMTQAVTIALEDKLAQTAEEASVSRRLARMLDMANAVADRLSPEQKAMDLAAELYDSDGLPR
jgi:hypothetical protein